MQTDEVGDEEPRPQRNFTEPEPFALAATKELPTLPAADRCHQSAISAVRRPTRAVESRPAARANLDALEAKPAEREPGSFGSSGTT